MSHSYLYVGNQQSWKDRGQAPVRKWPTEVSQGGLGSRAAELTTVYRWSHHRLPFHLLHSALLAPPAPLRVLPPRLPLCLHCKPRHFFLASKETSPCPLCYSLPHEQWPLGRTVSDPAERSPILGAFPDLPPGPRAPGSGLCASSWPNWAPFKSSRGGDSAGVSDPGTRGVPAVTGLSRPSLSCPEGGRGDLWNPPRVPTPECIISIRWAFLWNFTEEIIVLLGVVYQIPSWAKPCRSWHGAWELLMWSSYFIKNGGKWSRKG